MVEFKDPKIRVRCLECRKEHFIEMKYNGTEKEQRSIGFEYEHNYRGVSKCECGEDMKLLTTIFEYPKGYINYIGNSNESCLIMDDINKDTLNVLQVESKAHDEK